MATHLQAGVSEGQVDNLTVNRLGEVIFSAGPITNSPGCGFYSSRFMVNLDTSHGQAIYSLLLSAQANNTIIKIAGTETCDLRPTIESVQYIQIVK
jgi:hypothetical protein